MSFLLHSLKTLPLFHPHPVPHLKRYKRLQLIKIQGMLVGMFLKRELNIMKTHLLEKEAEVKDLNRKNKVLVDMIKIRKIDLKDLILRLPLLLLLVQPHLLDVPHVAAPLLPQVFLKLT